MQEKNIIVHAFGCRLSSLEAEKLKIVAENAGLNRAIIFNTCAVTNQAEKQAKQAIRKAAKENPETPIFVVGCAADNNPAQFETLPNVAAVIKNADKFSPEFYNADAAHQTENILINKFSFLSKGFVQIQNGCDYGCTFCIVHTLRGKNVSFEYSEILKQTKILTENGYSEIVLTGVDIAGFNGGLTALCKQLLNDVPAIKRLRLSSLDPARDWRELIDFMRSDPRMMPHMHLSMQSGSDKILQKMARRHRISDIKRIADYANGNISFSVDIICGFPDESVEDFSDTVLTLKHLHPIKIHAFPFSPRAGTPAATFPNQIERTIAKARTNDLIKLGNQNLHQFMENKIGKIESVYMERNNTARTPDDIEVNLIGGDFPEGAVINVKHERIENDAFISTCAE